MSCDNLDVTLPHERRNVAVVLLLDVDAQSTAEQLRYLRALSK